MKTRPAVRWGLPACGHWGVNFKFRVNRESRPFGENGLASGAMPGSRSAWQRPQPVSRRVRPLLWPCPPQIPGLHSESRETDQTVDGRVRFQLADVCLSGSGLPLLCRLRPARPLGGSSRLAVAGRRINQIRDFSTTKSKTSFCIYKPSLSSEITYILP